MSLNSHHVQVNLVWFYHGVKTLYYLGGVSRGIHTKIVVKIILHYPRRIHFPNAKQKKTHPIKEVMYEEKCEHKFFFCSIAQWNCFFESL